MVGASAGWSYRDMGCGAEAAGMDEDQLKRGVICTGKDVTCGVNTVDGMPTKSKEPLEEATGPATVTG